MIHIKQYVCIHTSCSMCVCVCSIKPTSKINQTCAKNDFKKKDVTLYHDAVSWNPSFSVAFFGISSHHQNHHRYHHYHQQQQHHHHDIDHPGLHPVPCRGCFKETVWRIFPLKHWKLPRTSSWPCVVYLEWLATGSAEICDASWSNPLHW